MNWLRPRSSPTRSKSIRSMGTWDRGRPARIAWSCPRPTAPTIAISPRRRLKRPRPEQKIHDAPLMRLKPVQLHRRNRADVEPVDVTRIQKFTTELGILGDSRAHECRPNLGQHLILRTFDDRRERKHVLLLRHRDVG